MLTAGELQILPDAPSEPSPAVCAVAHEGRAHHERRDVVQVLEPVLHQLHWKPGRALMHDDAGLRIFAAQITKGR